MKKVFLTLLIAICGISLIAQNAEKAKDLLQRKKLPEAKAAIDKTLENPKRANDLDALYTKVKVYIAISEDSLLRGTVPDAREQAFDALKKYVLADAKENKSKDDMKLIMMQLEQYKPVYDIYQGYYRTGAAYYNSNNFMDAFATFKKCLEVADYMIENNWTTMKFDTSLVLYTGIAAEKSNQRDTAAAYYTMLADRKIAGESMIEIYKWLTDHYHQKQDIATAQKFIKLGKELYPNDTYWTTVELEMASNNSDRKTLYEKYEEMIAKDPTNYIYPFNYGVELYREAYAEDVSKRPANSDEQIAKAQAMIGKSLELNPDYLQASLVLGQILYNQGVELSTQQRNFKGGVPNSKLTPEEIKQKEDLKTAMMKKFDEAIPYFEKIETALGSQGKLKGEAKRQLKDAYDLLTTIYDNKGDQEKMKEYEAKFNDVDKVH